MIAIRAANIVLIGAIALFASLVAFGNLEEREVVGPAPPAPPRTPTSAPFRQCRAREPAPPAVTCRRRVKA
jgi:hypothetical protein